MHKLLLGRSETGLVFGMCQQVQGLITTLKGFPKTVFDLLRIGPGRYYTFNRLFLDESRSNPTQIELKKQISRVQCWEN